MSGSRPPKPSRFVVAAEEEGKTLAALVRRQLGEIPWSEARRLCREGRVSVDDQPALDPALRLTAGRRVQVDSSETGRKTLPRAGSILYEDRHLVVVDKPAGMSSVPYERGERGTAVDLVRGLWRRRGRPRRALFVVHRIDKETSGLLLFAKTRSAERALGLQFRAHAVRRTYLCVAHGAVKAGRIESRLVTDRGDGLRGSTRRPGQGKRAVTHLEVMERLSGATLCRARLETGKTHQIRIHLAEAGHPLVGERVYIRDFIRNRNRAIESARLLLHAATLSFLHPLTGAAVDLASPLPADFLTELERLRPGKRS
jgi:23S rRNA pseudouridine1911/1915/1917 synthase